MKKIILLVEDESMLQEMYKDKLEESGYEVICASESKEALRLAKKEKPDLIILDMLLPRENGIYYLNQAKKDKEIANIPVVVFSNFDDPVTKKQAIKLGAKEYLIKTSYTPFEIVESIKKYL